MKFKNIIFILGFALCFCDDPENADNNILKQKIEVVNSGESSLRYLEVGAEYNYTVSISTNNFTLANTPPTDFTENIIETRDASGELIFSTTINGDLIDQISDDDRYFISELPLFEFLPIFSNDNLGFELERPFALNKQWSNASWDYKLIGITPTPNGDDLEIEMSHNNNNTVSLVITIIFSENIGITNIEYYYEDIRNSADASISINKID